MKRCTSLVAPIDVDLIQTIYDIFDSCGHRTNVTAEAFISDDCRVRMTGDVVVDSRPSTPCGSRDLPSVPRRGLRNSDSEHLMKLFYYCIISQLP